MLARVLIGLISVDISALVLFEKVWGDDADKVFGRLSMKVSSLFWLMNRSINLCAFQVLREAEQGREIVCFWVVESLLSSPGA